MKSAVRARFWVEAVAAWLAASVAVLTLFWHDWIEAIFGFDPDRHNGSAEWAIIAALFTFSLALALAARAERRRALA
jgi:DMSO/TMAO reductase YedYZ heme-binding membrane subunit